MTWAFPVLVVSYADLLWRQQRTLARLRFPARLQNDLSPSFVPRLDHDVFKGNHWKVHGSLEASRTTAPGALRVQRVFLSLPRS